jgi:transcriptional regulator with XRE-family HTH domain
MRQQAKNGDAMTIGDRLRSVIEENDFNLKSFAKAASIPYRSFQNYVSNKQKPGVDVLLKVREHLGVNLDWLLTGEGQPYADLAKVKRRRFTLGDLAELDKRFNNIWELGSVLSTLAPLAKGLVDVKWMADRLAEKQERGGLVGVDLDSLHFDEVRSLYAREFDDPEFKAIPSGQKTP